MDNLMKEAAQLADRFLNEEKQYQMGFIEAEQSNPKTRTLDKTFRESAEKGVRMLLSVDEDLVTLYKNTIFSEGFDAFKNAIGKTLAGGGKIILSGCGSTGRLCMNVERSWRVGVKRSGVDAALGERVLSLMTGGDYAVIRAVENFEDFESFSRRQAEELGVGKGDLLIGITATAETTSILGTAFYAAEQGAEVYMLVCTNPKNILGKLERVDRLYGHENVSSLYLPCGGMAVTGSTRMQSSTIEQAILLSALELVLSELAGDPVSKERLFEGFQGMIDSLITPESVTRLAALASAETELYKRGGYVTYFSEGFMLDILTDTTERSPTYATPPFRPQHHTDEPLSWAFSKNPALTTKEAWAECFGREPRCIEWEQSYYETEGIYNMRDISKARLMEFMIGKEPDPERESRDGVAVWVDRKAPTAAFDACASAYRARTELVYDDPLVETLQDIFEHLQLKLVMNTVSTASMAMLGRIQGNYMTYVSMSNKKLVDRGARIISDLCGVSYADALRELYYAHLQYKDTHHSPTQIAIRRLRGE